MDWDLPLGGNIFDLDQVWVFLPHTRNKTWNTEITVEAIDHFGSIEPRSVHPNIADVKVLYDFDQTACMIIVCMGKHNVCDNSFRSMIVPLDVIDDGLSGIDEASVDDMNLVPVLIIAKSYTYCVAVAVPNGKKIDFKSHIHASFTGLEVACSRQNESMASTLN
jgi:hypothetical protein